MEHVEEPKDEFRFGALVEPCSLVIVQMNLLASHARMTRQHSDNGIAHGPQNSSGPLYSQTGTRAASFR